MGIRKAAAQVVSAVSSAALKHVFRRPAGNFPGKVALYIDPHIIADLRSKLVRGSICVVGTNGKTTVTNMLADCLEAAGARVVCNRGGANLDSGVATSLLDASVSEWGVFECDELWLARILPGLKSRYVVLLNLFYDQLDRVGDVDYIQNSITGALKASPHTVLVYNADDPHCEKIARMVDNQSVPFGMGEGLSSEHGTDDAFMCQMCDTMLTYEYRSYGQLGSYSCPACDFGRSHLRFMARNCTIGASGLSFDVLAAADVRAVAGGQLGTVRAPYAGTYMLYNLLSVYAAGHLVGLSHDEMQAVMSTYDSHNGRLEKLTVHGRDVLLNLAKNPAGFNQNLGLVLREEGPVAAAFFINDKEGDGRDVSWIWDIDFERLAAREDVVVYVGGMRANDLQVRLRYAGVPAIVVDGAMDVMYRVAALPEAYKVFMIANYTSLPDVRADCVKMASDVASPAPNQAQRQLPDPLPESDPTGQHVRIVHLYPDLLNQGGDAGNVSVLAKRCAWRGISVDVQQVLCGQQPDFDSADIVVLGDGFDRQQRLACAQLLPARDAFADYVARGGVVLAVDGGLQVMGSAWRIGDDELAGLGIVDIRNGRAEDESRIVGDVVVRTELVDAPVVGFENHAGTTVLGNGVKPFGSVVRGVGNNEGDATEGVLFNNVVGTYVHGPVLAKCPELADWLIARALQVQAGGAGAAPGDAVDLAALDDSAELAARAFMLERLGVK